MAQIIPLHPPIADYQVDHTAPWDPSIQAMREPPVRIPEPMFTGNELVWSCFFSALGGILIAAVMFAVLL
ncbi:MAG: hypothetical protein ACJ8FS_16505 [Sphingomicrobium sp.]